MGCDSTIVLFNEMMVKLQDQIPEGEEAKFSNKDGAAGDSPNRLWDLVPTEMRERAFNEAMALSDDEAFACVNRAHTRAGLRKEMSHLAISFFANPFWKPLFEKAARSNAAAAKKAQRT